MFTSAHISIFPGGKRRKMPFSFTDILIAAVSLTTLALYLYR